jgi:putative hemolysin
VSKVVLYIIVILVIVSIGGFFSGSEMALVSLREGQVRALAKRGRRGQRAARLAQDPNRFFSAVQIGVTLATLFSGAYGADTLAGLLKSWLVRQHVPGGWAATVSFIVVTVAITFVSLVLGELAPKRIALQRAPRLALFAAPLLDRIASLARPIVWLLTWSTNLVVAMLGGDPRVGRQAITEQELRDLVTGAQALSADERHIVGEVFDAGKRQIREVLVPRTEVVFLDAETTVAQAAAIVSTVPHSRLPVYQDTYDNVIGFVHVRDLYGPGEADRSAPVGSIARPVKFLPISKTVLSALSEMRRERAHLAIVVDDYGGTAGIVTLEDLVEELIGDIRDEYDTDQAQATTLPAGVVEVDGLLNLDEFTEQTGIELPEGPYETVAGYVLAALGDLPSVGDSVQVAGRTITVTELDGRRIARLRVATTPKPPAMPAMPAMPATPATPANSAASAAPVTPVTPPASATPVTPPASAKPVKAGPAASPASGPVASESNSGPASAPNSSSAVPAGHPRSDGQARLDSKAPEEGG